jgi:hypothetical protein
MIMVIGPHRKKTEARADRALQQQDKSAATEAGQVPSPRGETTPAPSDV